MILSKPFAVLNNDGESLVIFMIGSIFHIESMLSDDGRLWNIQLTLSNHQDKNLKDFFHLLKQQFSFGNNYLENFGRILSKMKEFDLAEKCFHRLLNEYSSNDSQCFQFYQNLIDLALIKEDHQMMSYWNEKLTQLQIQNHSNHFQSKKSIEDLSHEDQINIKSKWIQNAVTVAGGNKQGNQLFHPYGISIDDENQIIYISEWGNNRIVQWKFNESRGEILLGKNGELNKPTDLVFDKKTNSLIICDYGNQRILRYYRDNSMNIQIIICNINCFGIAVDRNGDIYVSDWKNNEIRRWKNGETKGKIVAGGNGQGDRLDQLNCPTYIYVDDQFSIYISDCDNNRIMKWLKDAKQGMIVAGGNGQGNNLSQLSDPQGLIVDQLGNIYIADCSNYRIMCWSLGAKQGELILGGNGQGQSSNQFNGLRGLSFDQQGYIYVVDSDNHRIQKFIIDLNKKS